VKNHHTHQLQLLLKQSFVVWLLYQFHHDQSSLNVSHPSHHDHVTSSLNVGSHTELNLNEKPLFNVLLLLLNMHAHAMLSSNMNQFKFALFANSNALVLFKLTHKLIFNNMVLNFLMLAYSFNKLVLLVLSKISQLQLVHLLVSVLAHTDKKHHSVVHQVSNLVPVLLLVVVWMLVLVVDSVHHHLNHQAIHQVALVV
jgi:hypothetical protein